MTKTIFKWVGVILFFILLLYVSFFLGPTEESKDTVQIEIGSETITAELVVTEEEQTKGLSGRVSLPDNSGMLFVFDNKESRYFWMKEMNFPIDIIWINENEIVGVKKEAPVPDPSTPENQIPIYVSPEPVDKVLEINAGLFDEVGAKVGDEIEIN